MGPSRQATPPRWAVRTPPGMPAARWGPTLPLVLGLLLAAAYADGVGAQEAEPPADADANAANAAPADADSAESTARQEKNLLAWAVEALGWFYSIVFLALSFTLVALFVMNMLQASRNNVVPPDLIEGFEEQLNAKQWTAALELAAGDESFLGKVLTAGLTKLKDRGTYPQALEAMQEVGEEENMRLEHRLSYMALIGTISPMIGLMGTVQGMIGAFETISTTSAGAPSATELAGDISTALFTTLAGLIVAIPAIAAYNILRNRIARLVLEVGIVSEGLMSRFQNAGKAAS